MIAVDDIFAIEKIVEAATAAVLTALEVKAYTSATPPEFQKERPRVEVQYVHGRGQGRWVIFGKPDGAKPAEAWKYRRESAWKSELHLLLITGANDALHNNYRATIREVMNRFWLLINGLALPYQIGFSADNGTTPRYEPESGMYASRMMYQIDVSIQANAWAALNEST